jgi:3-dehydroquinate synthase
MKSMMERVTVSLGERSYDVVIGRGVGSGLMESLAKFPERVVITDETVSGLAWFPGLVAQVEGGASKFSILTVPNGETSKSLEQVGILLSRMAEKGFSRRTVVVAVGGGVVGDLAGFVAGIYLRGVSLVQVPTTLLAAVDSSVGGKTGVNLPEGKNLVGVFHQPVGVWIDLDFLDTLVAREFAAGMAEVIKYGVIMDGAFLDELEKGLPEDLGAMIRRCVEIKAAVVGNDERELTGRRALLNFGHTIGHALEQRSGYGELLHGEAVAVGMMGAIFLSAKVLGLAEGEVERLGSILKRHGLATTHSGVTYEGLAPAMMRDKKATSDGLRWVLAERMGHCRAGCEVPEELVREAVAFCASGKW